MKNIFQKLFFTSVIVITFVCVHSNVHAESLSNNAKLFFTTAKTTYTVGESVIIDVRLNSGTQQINAATGNFKITDDFVVDRVDTAHSIFSSWFTPVSILNNHISFEAGTIESYQGSNGKVLSIIGHTKKAGAVTLSFDDGSILANGANILGSMKSIAFNTAGTMPSATFASTEELPMPFGDITTHIATANTMTTGIPYITSYSATVSNAKSLSIKGKGEPHAMTRIDFNDISQDSFGRMFINSFSKNKKTLPDDVVLTNDANGLFSYVSPSNLVAGVYNVVPSIFTATPNETFFGTGIQIFVKDNTFIQCLIVLINILVFAIPVVLLILVIIFLPWYFRKRLHLLSKKMELEGEKIESEAQLIHTEEQHEQHPTV